MKTYTVTWVIDVDADTHVEAAQRALEIQRDEDSIATVFDVVEHGGGSVIYPAKTMRIDFADGSVMELPR